MSAIIKCTRPLIRFRDNVYTFRGGPININECGKNNALLTLQACVVHQMQIEFKEVEGITERSVQGLFLINRSRFSPSMDLIQEVKCLKKNGRAGYIDLVSHDYKTLFELKLIKTVYFKGVELTEEELDKLSLDDLLTCRTGKNKGSTVEKTLKKGWEQAQSYSPKNKASVTEEYTRIVGCAIGHRRVRYIVKEGDLIYEIVPRVFVIDNNSTEEEIILADVQHQRKKTL
ncbi:hypothetical protein ABK040_012541 [Willaertia magna]